MGRGREEVCNQTALAGVSPFMKISIFLLSLLLLCSGLHAQAPDRSDLAEKLKERSAMMLKRFPEADADQDGVLSREEFRAFVAKRRETDTPVRPERPTSRPKVSPPAHADVPYGEHEKQRFDLWTVPDASEPTPLVLFIHGGGFRSGDKSLVRPGTPEKYHAEGIAFASMNYRLSDEGTYPMMMHDAARGLQTIRHRAAEWNIDPERIVCYGGSAGAGISLWLAFHDDLADPNSEDPIARQSTRILAAGSMNGQSSYDIHTFREWFNVPDLQMGPALPAFYGIDPEDDLHDEALRKQMKDASPIEHLCDDDTAPVYMLYSRPNVPVDKTTESSVWVHHVVMGLKLQEAMKKKGLECVVTAPALETEVEDSYGSLEAFLIAKLKAAGKARE